MSLFDTNKRLFSSNQPTQTATRGAYFPHTLKPYGNLSQSIQGIQGMLTGRKKLYAQDVASQTANYYLRTNHAVASFIREIGNNVVGSTLGSIQSKVAAFSPEENQNINNFIEQEWYKFSKAENFDLSGRFDISEFLTQAITKYLIEGEINIRSFKLGKYGSQYQLLDFSSLDFTYHTGNVFNGVEIDGYTRPVAYWIVDNDEKKYRIPAKEFIHIAAINGVSEYRGTSVLTPSFQQLENIDSYEQAEITAAINEATSVIYYKSDSNYVKAYEGASSVADIATFNPNTTTDTTTPSGYDPSNILAGSGVQHGGIAIEALPAGVDIGQLASNHPNTGFVDSLKMLYRNLGAALGLPYSTLLLDLSDTNYSSMRAGEIFKRKLFRKLSNLLISKLLEPIYTQWLTKLIQSNKTVFPKINGSYDAYFQVSFPLPKFQYVDPEKDIASDIAALDNGLTTWSALINEQGIDFEDFLLQKKADEERAKQLGVSLETKQDKINAVELAKVQSFQQAPTEKAPVKKKQAPQL